MVEIENLDLDVSDVDLNQDFNVGDEGNSGDGRISMVGWSPSFSILMEFVESINADAQV